MLDREELLSDSGRVLGRPRPLRGEVLAAVFGDGDCVLVIKIPDEVIEGLP
jgi:hypothetical protein